MLSVSNNVFSDMQTLYFSLIIVLLICFIDYNHVVFAQSYPNDSSIPEGTNPPVIITQVELDSAFSFLPDNQTCNSQHASYPQHNCLTNLDPDHKVKCAYFFGTVCQPLHQYTSGTNKNCLGSQSLGNASAPQWFDVYNTQDKPIQLQYFDVRIPSTASSGVTEAGPYYSIPVIEPYEKCTFTFSPINEAVDLDPTNRTIIVSYDYDGKHYTTTTPKLTDIYNDIRTWQFDGNKWVFAEQNTVEVPEFGTLAIPVLLIGVVSVIAFYRIRFGK